MKKLIFTTIIIITVMIILSAENVSDLQGNKKLDITKYHNVGNIWLRVSNYGFFGSGRNTPRWPSLEYPGGSAIDYLFLGGLWFGAKKFRRDNFQRKLYWLPDAGSNNDIVAFGDTINGWTPDLIPVVDTLVSVGIDGHYEIYEFLPAYNPLETNLEEQYLTYNSMDNILSTSTRVNRRGEDDDGDGLIDEDPAGYSFPFRNDLELPNVFSNMGELWIHQFSDNQFTLIRDNLDIWFPLGFVNLGDNTNSNYNFSQPQDDDNDTLIDEDGYPVSEQDYISFYYDYSPFGTPGERDWGSEKNLNAHIPLNVRVRQMSYQWSYDYIKNLVYVEFNITNMNELDTLYDCAMGVYMDSDVGPQAWGGNERSLDDISSYVAGESYEFAYTYDEDKDSGLTTGFIGSRVCSPDPEQLDFACWYWNRGDGPDDYDPLDFTPTGLTANQKYWLLTDRNPEDTKYTSLRDFPNSQIGNPDDTRYLFGFFGDMNGLSNPTSASWNLSPGNTMKIVIGIFPGNSLLELKNQSSWSKIIYGKAQDLETVILPDTFIHYVAPEPPLIPKTFVKQVNNGNAIEVYWDNRSEMDNVDLTIVNKDQIGWQSLYSDLDSYIANFTPEIQEIMLENFWPENWNNGNENQNALVNPWTGYRLRHDFQGYNLYGRTGSGSRENWMLFEKWDKVDTEQDIIDYQVNEQSDQFFDFGGEQGFDKGLPNQYDEFGNIRTASENDTFYYHYDEYYQLIKIIIGDPISGYPIYNYEIEYSESLQNYAFSLSFDDQVLLFKDNNISDEVYLSLYDDGLIPLAGHGGQAYITNGVEDEKHKINRLSRRFYKSSISHPPKGIEYYVAVTAWDRGMPEYDLGSLESGRDADANMKTIFPGPESNNDMDKILVIPNPYLGLSNFDGRREHDEKGDKSRRLWFINIPERCKIKIFTLAGDLVDVIDHEGEESIDIITMSKAVYTGISANGIAPWDLLSKNNQVIAPGVYLYSVKNKDNGEIKVGKFVIIK